MLRSPVILLSSTASQGDVVSWLWKKTSAQVSKSGNHMNIDLPHQGFETTQKDSES